MDLQTNAPDTSGNGASNYYDQPVLKPPDWGWEVIGYLWLGGIGAGSFVTGSLATLRGNKDDRAIAKLAYTISTLAMAASAPLLISHLGRPERFYHMMRVFKPSSPMNAGVWGMTALSGSALTAAVLGASKAGTLPRAAMALAGAPIALFVGAYTGVLLGHSSVPLWAKSPLLPAVFACSSLATGAAAVALFAELFGVGSPKARKRIAKAERMASVAEGLALAAWLKQTGEFAKPLREAPLKDVFEMGAVVAGLALPLSLPSTKKPGLWDALKPALALAGGLALRYAIVEGGRRSSQDPDAYLKFTSTPPEN